MEQLLRQQAERDFGDKAAPYVLRAWHDSVEAIRSYPYSDEVARYPGPLQRGRAIPSSWIPSIRNFGRARAWQNDLRWTEPWGPEITAKYLGQLEDWFAKGDAELEQARHLAPREYHSAIGLRIENRADHPECGPKHTQPDRMAQGTGRVPSSKIGERSPKGIADHETKSPWRNWKMLSAFCLSSMRTPGWDMRPMAQASFVADCLTLTWFAGRRAGWRISCCACFPLACQKSLKVAPISDLLAMGNGCADLPPSSRSSDRNSSSSYDHCPLHGNLLREC